MQARCESMHHLCTEPGSTEVNRTPVSTQWKFTAGAVYGMCPEACIYYFGLSWWAVWFQFIILIASIPVGVRTQLNSVALWA